jgi:ribosomal protein L40E
MLPTHCAVCEHKNPPDAKFCNECGSPLHLTSCRHCGAVNDRAATHCYSCGAQIPASSMAAEAAPVSTVLDATAASKILSDIGVESRRAPLAESAVASLEVLEQRSSNETVSVSEHAAPVISMTQRVADVVPLPSVVTTSGPHLRFRAILPALLVVAVALSAYYVYRYPLQRGDWLRHGPPEPAVPASADAGRTPSASSAADAGVAPLDSPPVNRGILAGASLPPGPPVDTNIEVAASPATRDSVGSTRQPPRSTASQITAPSSNETAGASAPVTTIAVEPRNKTTRTVDDRGASQTVATPSITSYPETAAVEAVLPRQADSRVDVRPDTQRSSACTEAVAALGFCNPSTTRESK